MLVAGLQGVSTVGLDSAIIVTLQSYVSANTQRELITAAERVLGCPVRLVLLSEPTSSMVDTIVAGISEMPEDGPIVIKDTDNNVQIFEGQVNSDENFIVSADLRIFDNVPAANKSFVEFDSFGMLSNIIEKRITSSFINTGLMGFASASQFLVANSGIQSSGERYVSDVIRNMLQSGSAFRVLSAKRYEDWGTHKEWIKTREAYANLVVSLEGVVFSASGEDSLTRELIPLSRNIQILKKLLSQKNLTLTFMSSRRETERPMLEKQLLLVGFEEFDLLLNMYSAKSFIISAYSPQDPFPNVLHVGVPQDTDLNDGLLGSI